MWGTAHNKRKQGAPFVDMARLKLCEKTVVVAPLFLPRFALRHAARAGVSVACRFRDDVRWRAR